MAIRNSISEFRTTKLYLTLAGFAGGAAVAAPIDAYKAAISLVEEIEAKYAKGGAAAAPDLEDVPVLKTGTIAHQIHVFSVSTNMTTGVYTIVYVETVPTSDDVS